MTTIFMSVKEKLKASDSGSYLVAAGVDAVQKTMKTRLLNYTNTSGVTCSCV